MSRIAEVLDPGAYHGLPGHKEPTTSRDAALAVSAAAPLLRERVFVAVREAGARGLTPDECAAKIGESVLAVRPRFSELSKAVRIVETGDRRRNDSGLKAKVWRVR